MTTLSGIRLLLTRTAEDCAAWEGPLVQAGAAVTCWPCIRTEVIDDAATQAALMQAISTADWLILTSRRGVDAVEQLIPAGALSDSVRIAVVGQATAEAAIRAFGRVDHIGSGTAASLAAELTALVANEAEATEEHDASGNELRPAARHFVAAVAANAADVLGKSLAVKGSRFTRVDVYRTVPLPPAAERTALADLKVDAILFASPSTVTGFMNQIATDSPIRAYSIGPTTSKALRKAGLTVSAEAQMPTIDGMIAIIAEDSNQAGGPTP